MTWYARHPILLNDKIYFVAGDDLFKVAKDGGDPQLCFQSTGTLYGLVGFQNKIACIATEDGGPDIYIFDTITNELNRITFFEKGIKIVSFDEKGIMFLSGKDSTFRRDMFLYHFDLDTKIVTPRNIGPINAMDVDGNDAVYQRRGYGYLNWKGYKGGTVGTIWLNDKKLIDLEGNCLRPFFAGDRVYFMHDNGINGNIFSCDRKGEDIKQHTMHTDFHVQDLIKCGGQFLYTKSGQIFVYDIQSNSERVLELGAHMPHPDSRSYITRPGRYLTSVATDGENLMMAVRGNVLKCGLWSGGMRKLNQDLRFRVAGMLPDNKIFAIKEPPKACLHIYDVDDKEIGKFPLECGKIGMIKVSEDYIAYSNHKHELRAINHKTGEDVLVYKSTHRISGFDWSADGRYIIFAAACSSYCSGIYIYDFDNKTTHEIIKPDHYAMMPIFDPGNQYLCFLSNVNADCIHDGVHLDWAFENTMRPYLISLKKNHNLLMPWKNDVKDEEKDDAKEEANAESKAQKLEIDFDNIADRVVPLGVKPKNYTMMFGLPDSKIMLVSDEKFHEDDEEEDVALGNGSVDIFCLKTLANEPWHKNISYIVPSLDRKHCVFEEDGKLKISKIGEKSDEPGYKKGGVFDWARYKSYVEPRKEWQQMFEEVWWLMKEFFWSPGLAGMDWDKIWQKYEPYIKNIRTKQELDDLINELQGEVGTSHAFILDDGGVSSGYSRGYLGAEFEFDTNKNAYKIKNILNSNLRDGVFSPLKTANFDVKEGEFLFAIDGVALSAENAPEKLLNDKAGLFVTLEIGADAGQPRKVEVRALPSESDLKYRNWVDTNRKYVSDKTEGKVGYIHIPDMQKDGFKEFFQSYLHEYNKQALIIDARRNGGGNIACVILDQLMRKRTGLDVPRWYSLEPLPYEASRGAYVLLVDADTGSDGDVFANQFKLLKMGPIIGERTWGGTVGIAPRYRLIDGTLTSQPEMAGWFVDTHYSIENTGVVPDVEITNPHIGVQTVDNDIQLQAGIAEALKLKGADFEEQVNQCPHPARVVSIDLKKS